MCGKASHVLIFFESYSFLFDGSNLYQKGCFANDKLVKISVNWKINFEPQSCKVVSIATLTASLQIAVVTFDIDAIFAAVLFWLNQCLVFQLNDDELSTYI